MVKPTINNCMIFRVLISGGSSLNILFSGALDAMQISQSAIKLVTQTFYDIVLGSSSMPIGHILLPITFARHDNFWTKKILLNLVNSEIVYNAILGRPILAKFMDVVHYAYQYVKIPRPVGVITIRGCPKVVLCCDK
ncbi:uncharacterized protein LOC133927593 [Phragmites australis]|uniref:uncharacterized protein LOC133927593 n=1 Tax=Phragmites australis TaxID=29695 RepID=UPI002D78C87A|nr:uncharacterized protein LOC133927593 [Phragmites australis]